MKYLKLYEGFKSKGISAVLSFISKKVDRNNYNRFLNDLRRLADRYDFTLSDLNDNEINYLPVSKAITIKGEAINPSGIYAIKYWFSVKDGYLCQTGVGNLTMNYNKYLQGEEETELNDSHIEILKRKYNGITGILVPCNLSDLNTGDKIVGVCEDHFNIDYLTCGEIYVDDRDPNNIQSYFYQNDNEGTTPSSVRNGIQLPVEYNIYNGTSRFSFAWSMGTPNLPAEDHCCLYRIIPDNKPLRLKISKPIEETKDSEWDYNLPMYNNPPQSLNTWVGYSDILKLAKEGNFAIILYLDDVLIREVSKSDVIRDRKENKKDALKLMHDDDIKEKNIQRYLKELFNSLGIKEDTQELKNLKSLVKSTTLDNYFLINSYYTYSSIDRLSDFISYLYSVMTKENISYSYGETIRTFNNIKKNALRYKTKYNTNVKYLKNKKIKEVNEVIEKILKINSLISKYFNDKNVETIEELKSIQILLRSISDFSQEGMLILSRYMRYLIDSINNTTESIDTFLKNNEYLDKDYKSDIRKLDVLEKILISDFLK